MRSHIMTDHDVMEIRTLHGRDPKKYSALALSSLYNVSVATIHNILAGRTHKHLPLTLKEDKPIASLRLSEADIEFIKSKYNTWIGGGVYSKWTIQKLAKTLGVSPATVKRVLTK